MNLSQIILENERQQQDAKNRQIVRGRLKELVYAYPTEVTAVLHKTGVAASTVLPRSVLHAIVVKNLATNSEFRETIAKMILKLDGYSAANGQGWQLFGGALSAIGSVLSGIGRSQGTTQTSESQTAQTAALQKELEEEQAKRKRTAVVGWIIISVVSILAIILLVKTVRTSKQLTKLQTT